MTDPSWGWNDDKNYVGGYNANQHWQETQEPWRNQGSYRLVHICQKFEIHFWLVHRILVYFEIVLIFSVHTFILISLMSF